MNILLTGGAGFIGSNLAQYLLKTYPNDKVITFDKLTYAGNLESLKSVEGNSSHIFIKGDICDAPLVRKTFKDYDIDAVLHLAAESHVDRSILGPKEFIETNVMGTFTLLEEAKNAWGSGSENVFVNVSTDEVYGSLGKTGAFTELTPYAPNSPYSASKASADHLVRSYFHTFGLKVITTHCSNNYGAFQFPEKLIPVIILNALARKKLPIYGDGLNIRDWIHVLDHARGIDVALRSGKAGEVYNFGADAEWTNIDLVRFICSELDELRPATDTRPYSDLIEFVKDRPGHDQRYAIDSSKAKTELGWSPENDFKTAMRSTIKWYLDNLDWTERVKSGEYISYYAENYKDR
ncbi:MAG: dTDP-glucose 4,6-dehydratase [Deltaproteobacteria bacterium]|nr:dTDP-glucose 4,6-dehydratase [Deltaproteobacteria bacterium]